MVFVKMARAIARLKAPEQFEPWLFRLARNTCIDHLRRQKLRRIFIPFAPEHENVPEPAGAVDTEELDALRHALAQLRPKDRALLALVQEGRSHAEIAETFKTSVAAVKARLHRAREQLRQHYHSDEKLKNQAWARLREHAAAQITPGFPERVLRPRAPRPRRLFIAHFAMCAATAAACLVAVALYHARVSRATRTPRASLAGARSPRRRTTSSRAYEGPRPRSAPDRGRVRDRLRRGDVGGAPPAVPAPARGRSWGNSTPGTDGPRAPRRPSTAPSWWSRSTRSGPQMEAFRTRVSEIYAEFDRDIATVLTPEQRAELREAGSGRSAVSWAPPSRPRADKPLSDEQIEQLLQRPFRTLAFFVVLPMTLDRMTSELKLDEAQRGKVKDLLRVRREKFIELVDSAPPLSLMLSRLAPIAQRLAEPGKPGGAPAH